MSTKTRSIQSIKKELLKKSREAVLAAVQIYNNPQITFKSESFIILSNIAWTYLMHAYYRSKNIEYRYYETKGKKKFFSKTKKGADKYWELERCLDCKDCPLDKDTKNNLKFLIGIRHEIEHQMTNKIDKYLSAKLQASAINYNYYITKLFGEKFSVDKELSISIQFSEINPMQKEQLTKSDKLTPNLQLYIAEFEKNLSDEELCNPRYAYRVLFIEQNVNRKGQADEVIEFHKPDSESADEIKRILVKDREIPKFLPTEIIEIVKGKGYKNFKIRNHTELWKVNNAKNPNKGYGVQVSKQWYWYQKWVDFVIKYCEENSDKFR
ncbi:MAG: DUF3644 domain-containing protein [Oscillospiraceae bacterium]|jgi:hypothetical protein|nr:DUF3644 domain-containing protein [Oscillospiraceae bacterium]